MTLTLISHNLCPYVQRVAIALAEKNVPFERVMIDLANKPDWFLNLSPLGKVPLMRLDRADGREAVLFESAAIAEYVDETYREPRLMPSDAIARAQHRAWIEFASSILADIWRLETAKDASPFMAACRAIETKLARLELALGNGPYFAGADFGLVDAAIAPAFRYFDVFDEIAPSVSFAATPKVAAWRNALALRTSVRDAALPGYRQNLRAFLAKHEAHLLTLAPTTI
jgi:glutathione S-transferase